MIVRVSGAVVDSHSHSEGDDLEKHEDGDEPRVAIDLPRAVAEEGELLGARIAGDGSGKREFAMR